MTKATCLPYGYAIVLRGKKTVADVCLEVGIVVMYLGIVRRTLQPRPDECTFTQHIH